MPGQSKITFMILTNSRRFNTGVKSEELFKIVGQVYFPVSHFWKTEQTFDSLRVRTRVELNIFHISVNLLAFHCLLTVTTRSRSNKGGGRGWGGGTLILFDTCEGSGHLFLLFFFFFEFLNNIILGGFRNINILWA